MFGANDKTTDNPTDNQTAPKRASLGVAVPTKEEAEADSEARGWRSFTPKAGRFRATCLGPRTVESTGSRVIDFQPHGAGECNGRVGMFYPDEQTPKALVLRFAQVLEILGAPLDAEGTFDERALENKDCIIEVVVKNDKSYLKWSGSSVGVLPADADVSIDGE